MRPSEDLVNAGGWYNIPMTNHKQFWEQSHTDGNITHYTKTSSFAEEVLCLMKPASRVLELGCGVGNDAIAFANAGHSVIATDFSEIAIKKDIERGKNIPNLTFQVLDMNKPFPTFPKQFDCVYARLSLHYFTDEITRKIIHDIYSALKPDGYFCFICKTVDDSMYGLGTKIETDMYDYHGHIRHFFSEEYTKLLLNGKFFIEKIELGKEIFEVRESAYIKVIAKKYPVNAGG